MKKKIFIAEDDPGILEAMQLILEDHDFEVMTVNNGYDMKNIKGPLPEIYLLDIWMSGIDGGEICKKLKSDQKTKDIPVILVSANRDTEKIAAACGADDYLLKPFDMHDLLNKINQYIGK